VDRSSVVEDDNYGVFLDLVDNKTV